MQKGESFCHLDLAKNNLGNNGVSNLLRGILSHNSLVSLDLGSNDVTNEGNSLLFRALRDHPSISVLNVANHDRMHRNRIGISACQYLRDLLIHNQVLSSLNINGNRISNEGLKIISEALTELCRIVILNISNNDLEG